MRNRWGNDDADDGANNNENSNTTTHVDLSNNIVTTFYLRY